jgi:hypothetical protein
MKTIQALNVIVLAFLVALAWITHRSSSAMFEMAEKDSKYSSSMAEFTNEALSGKKKESVDHLLAAMQHMTNASSFGAKANHDFAKSINEVTNMVFGLIALQVLIIVLCQMQYNKSLQPTSARTRRRG